MTPLDFLGKLGDLFAAYLRFWPFALFHLVVASFIFRSRAAIRAEASFLERWTPLGEGEEPRKRGRLAAVPVLDDFVRECRELGARGLLVPMTDFSDRLDDKVEGLLTELNDRIHLLMVVGIAGTMFGVFDFLARARTAGDVTALMGDALAQAFPVGVIGLLLMLCAQLLSHPLERRLRRSVSVATTRASQLRRDITRSHSDLYLDTARDIERALGPLATLQATLTEIMKPVVNTLYEQLRESLKLVAEQAGLLRELSSQFVDGTTKLEKGVNSLRVTTEDVRKSITAIPALLQTAQTQLEAHSAAAMALQGAMALQKEGFQFSVANLSEAKESFQKHEAGFAETVRGLDGRTTEALGAFVQRAASSFEAGWADSSSQVVQDIGLRFDARATGLLEPLREKTAQLEVEALAAARNIQDAAQKWTLLGEGLDDVLSAPKREVEKWRGDLDREILEILARSKATEPLAERLDGIVKQTDALASRLGDIERNSRETVEKAGATLSAAGATRGEIDGALREARGTKRELREAVDFLNLPPWKRWWRKRPAGPGK